MELYVALFIGSIIYLVLTFGSRQRDNRADDTWVPPSEDGGMEDRKKRPDTILDWLNSKREEW